MKRAIAAFALVCLPAHAAPGYWSGNELVEHYRAFKRVESGNQPGAIDYAGASAYIGYLRAVYEFTNTVEPAYVCVPDSKGIQDVGFAVGLYMELNKSELSTPAAILVRKALWQAFPCGPKLD